MLQTKKVKKIKIKTKNGTILEFECDTQKISSLEERVANLENLLKKLQPVLENQDN